MARYSIQSAQSNLLMSIALGDVMLVPGSVSSGRFKIEHSDGSFTVFRGSGISLDWMNFDPFSATGIVTSVRHFDSSRTLIDKITGFSQSVSELHYAIHLGFWLYGPLSGDDTIISNPADPAAIIDDTIVAGLGNDVVHAGSGGDYVDGSFGADTLYGGEGNDTLRGDTDTFETVNWKNGHDTLIGGAGDDVLYGGAGNDRLIGAKAPIQQFTTKPLLA